MASSHGSGITSASAITCPVCNYVGAFDRLHNLPIRCSECSHVWWPPGLDPDLVEGLYSDEYFSGGEYRDYVADQAVLEANFRRHLEWIAENCVGKRMFELGCAYGFFGRLAVEEYGYAYEGIDVAPEAVEYAATEFGLDVSYGSILDHEFHLQEYDIMCLWDVVEHLASPTRYVECLSQRLSRNGALLLTTGDIGSRVARLQGRHWRLIHPPTHVHYFTRQSLSTMMEAVGLEVALVSYVGHTRDVKSMLGTMAALRGGAGVGKRICRWLSQALPSTRVTINLHDIMFACCRRPVSD